MTLAMQQRSRLSRWLRRSVWLLLALIIAPIAAVALLVGRVWLGQPELDGERMVPGLGAEVTIARDSLGVVHIKAATEQEAYFALGFAHAQDRFFQMEMLRRLAAGRLAEVVGPFAAGTDAHMRILGVDRMAEQDVANLPADIRTIYQRYADGVNAWLQTRHGVAADELTLALAPNPEPWTPAHSIAWTRLMSLRLVSNWGSELMRLRLAASLTPEQMADLWPDYPADGAITTPEIAEAALAAARAIAAMSNPDDGSNAWAVTADRSATGAPLLANDPHLGLTTPATWHLVRMEAPGFLLAGAASPGMPALVLGHNGHVAWGLTNATTDTSDVYIETIDPQNPDRYLTPDGPKAFEKLDQVIRVRFGKDRKITVRRTRHGPVISDGNDTAPEGTALSLAHTGLLENEGAAVTLHRINRARKWGDMLDALKVTNGPQQNVFYAGPDGVGMATGGLLPIRKSGDGYMPADGASGAGDWVRFADVSAMPQVFEPSQGWVANANNKIAPDDYPLWLGREWGYAGRMQRIVDQLQADGAITPDRVAAIQTDVKSPIAIRLKPIMLSVLGESALTDAAASRLEALNAWDNEMRMDDASPGIFFAWMRTAIRQIFADELDDDFAGWFGLRAEVLERALTERPVWCDNIMTSETETCQSILKSAFEAAVLEVEASGGQDEPTWGAIHQVNFRHMGFGRLPVIGSLFNLRIPSPGGQETVNRAAMRFSSNTDPYGQGHGPGLRALYDLADLDASRFMIGPGQSGRLFSDNRSSLAEKWRDGAYLTLGPLSAPSHVLTLKPEQP
jgi:penicillin G amidase